MARVMVAVAFAILFTAVLLFNFDAIEYRLGCAGFLFALYAMFVALDTSGRRRELSRFMQTVLGVTTALAIAAIFDASAEWYVAALGIGLILGFTADKWAENLDLPL